MTGTEGRVPVAILGATGLVGQHLIMRLHGHPIFRVAQVVGSPSRAGQRYGESVEWILDAAPPAWASGLVLSGPGDEIHASIVLSALPATVARTLEPRWAAAGRVVCTNASAFRMEPDVPIVVPEVNADALSLVRRQPWYGRRGALVANPNCMVAGLALALGPIASEWGIRSGAIVTLQALSGAGVGGACALRMSGNVVPHIPGEAEKIGAELGKVLGCRMELAVSVNRVPVVDGHLAHVFLRLARTARPEHIRDALRSFRADREWAALPSVPRAPLVVREEADRPQPRLDSAAGGGMVVSVGQIRRLPPYDVAFTVVVHNGIRGAAGGCLANAELCVARGFAGASVLE
jgi:aspartate-semialdehyde dehydrogenase